MAKRTKKPVEVESEELIYTEAEQPSEQPREPGVGDIVVFRGTKCYSRPTAATGERCSAGRAQIVGVSHDETAKHPYRIKPVKGGGCSAYGWVDKDSIEPIQPEDE